MSSTRALERLHAYQDEALDLAAQAEVILADVGGRDTASLARLRWTLMRTLTAYQLFKHREIFDPALARATPADALGLLRMKRACVDMGDAFRAFVQRWSAADTQTHWLPYRADAMAIIARLRAHIDRERRDVATLITKATQPVIRPPAAAPPRQGRPTPAG